MKSPTATDAPPPHTHLFMALLPERLLLILRITVSLAWIVGAILPLLKPFSPLIRRLLNYGKLSPTAQQSKNKFLSVPLRLAWSLFYSSGLLLSVLIPIALHTLGISSPSFFYLPSILLQLQMLRRLYECVCVHNFSNKRMTYYHFLIGNAYYVLAVSTVSLDAYRASVSHPIIRGVAVILFISASLLQHAAHIALANTVPLVGKYGLPTSPLFSYIVCPHYLAEVFIYASVAVLVQSVPTFFMFLFDVSVMTTTAVDTAQWYKTTFPKHLLPRERRYAIFPLLL